MMVMACVVMCVCGCVCVNEETVNTYIPVCFGQQLLVVAATADSLQRWSVCVGGGLSCVCVCVYL
jgi:hypothetical protein